MRVMAAVYCDPVKVPTCLLANQAAVTENGLLNVIGGGWEHFEVLRFPASITGWIAGLFELDAVDRGVDHVVRMTVVARDGSELASQAFIINDVSRLVPFAKQFSVVALSAGTIKVDLATGSEVVSTPFEVRVADSPLA